MSEGLRLARRVQVLLGCSYTRAKHEVEVGHVLVNGNVAGDPGQTVTDSDEVAHNASLPRRRRPPALPPIVILHLDQDVVVVDKPAGVVVHPTLAQEEDTVMARVAAAVERQVGEHRRIFVVHRLDRDTSGVMMFALSSQAAQNLQAQLRVHRIERRYHALVGGDFTEAVEVDRSIGRPRPGARRAALGPGKGGQAALTTFTPIRRLGVATLVEANLGTGRTHQVRVHLSYLGHPVLGDSVYGDPRKDPVQAPRLALHAALLSFNHPRTGARLSFTSHLPADLLRVLRMLRQHKPSEQPAAPTPRPRRRGSEEATPRPPRRRPHLPGAPSAPTPPGAPPRRRLPRARRPG
ncbi:MAG: RluA family pseudouridine synthase [Thermoanaerobaculaceae bacterium]|jgi:23S rRNA pseudouridine1911/1915/1917 synthase|nr:RluA family pseudouridine synthase [Thermoanaerobaculaceae bacterium]